MFRVGLGHGGTFEFSRTGGIEKQCRSGKLAQVFLCTSRIYVWIPQRCHALHTLSIQSCHSLRWFLVQLCDNDVTMYALLNLSTCIITILIALLPAIVHPTSGDESLFYPDSEPLGPLPDDNVGAADASYTNQDSMTDVLAFAPPNRENPDVSFQAPTDSIGMDALNPDPLNSLDSPLLLAAEEDWDWDCPEGKQSYCCSEGRINPLIPTHYGGCRNCGYFFSLIPDLLITTFNSRPWTDSLGFPGR